MDRTAKEYINEIKKPNDTKVFFRYEGLGDIELPINEFVEQYGHKKVSFNADFLDNNNCISKSFIFGTR